MLQICFQNMTCAFVFNYNRPSHWKGYTFPQNLPSLCATSAALCYSFCFPPHPQFRHHKKTTSCYVWWCCQGYGSFQKSTIPSSLECSDPLGYSGESPGTLGFSFWPPYLALQHAASIFPSLDLRFHSKVKYEWHVDYLYQYSFLIPYKN